MKKNKKIPHDEGVWAATLLVAVSMVYFFSAHAEKMDRLAGLEGPSFFWVFTAALFIAGSIAGLFLFLKKRKRRSRKTS